MRDAVRPRVARPRTDHVSDARAVLLWMEDAHFALDLGHACSDSMVRALVATPDLPPTGAHDTPRTWYLEEYERVMRQQLRDPVPMAGTLDDVERWRDRQGRRSDRLADLLDQHAECIALARAFVRREDASTARDLRPRRAPVAVKRPGRRAADLALDTLGHAA